MKNQIAVLFSSALLPLCVCAQDTHEEDERHVTPLSLALTYPCRQFPNAPSVTVYGLRLGVLMDGSGLITDEWQRKYRKRYTYPEDVQTDVYGLSVGLFAMDDRNVTGLQLSGLFNTTDVMTGVQISSLFNINDTGARGVCIAGLVNIVGNGNMAGVQIAGLLNIAKKITGVQCALINFADNVNGVQIGLLNLRKGRQWGECVGLPFVYAGF